MRLCWRKRSSNVYLRCSTSPSANKPHFGTYFSRSIPDLHALTVRHRPGSRVTRGAKAPAGLVVLADEQFLHKVSFLRYQSFGVRNTKPPSLEHISDVQVDDISRRVLEKVLDGDVK